MTDQRVYVDFVRDSAVGNGAAHGPRPLAAVDQERAGGSNSVFHFDLQGSVVKSTHAGNPWLRFIRQTAG